MGSILSTLSSHCKVKKGGNVYKRYVAHCPVINAESFSFPVCPYDPESPCSSDCTDTELEREGARTHHAAEEPESWLKASVSFQI